MTAPMLNRPVVVGVDGSEFSLRALDWASDHAVLHDCPLRILHVPTGSNPNAEQLRAIVENRVMLRAAPRAPSVTWQVRRGSRADILIDEAARARLLVLGHREPQPLLGSTLRAVLAHGIGMVAVVPASWPADAKPTGRIVVGIKDDSHAGRILETAFKLAEGQRATVRVVQAIDRPKVHKGRSLLDETHRQEAKALAELRAAVDEPRHKFPYVSVQAEVIQDEPARLLRHLVRDADLLVLGGHPRPGLPTMIGSTTESILQEVDRPVVLVRPAAEGADRQTDAA